MVVTRAPKSRFYGSSPALSYRVAAAVLQKNRGATHIVDVFQKAGLSPGGVTQKLRAMHETVRQKQVIRQKREQYKKRRLFLKGGNTEERRVRREGVCYASGMSNTMERAVAATALTDVWIPEATPLEQTCKVVIVDTETTSVFGDKELIQVAAKCGDEEFSAYVYPSKSIHPDATEKTDFTKLNGRLLYHGDPVQTTPSDIVARDFLSFLSALESQVILVGHNIKRFDMPVILQWLRSHGIAKDLCNIMYGLTDTMPLLKQGKVRAQDELAKTYLVGPEWDHAGAHNAITDCILLEGLLHHFEITEDVLKEKAESLTVFLEGQARLVRERRNTPALQPLLQFGVKDGMVKKMARHGITIEALQQEFKLHGPKGVAVSLGVQVNGKPRVTTTKRIVQLVTSFIEQSLPPPA